MLARLDKMVNGETVQVKLIGIPKMPGRRRRMMAVSERLRSPKELLGRISRRLPAPRPCSPVPPAARVALVVLVFFQVSSAFAVPIAQWGGPWRVTPGFSLTTVGDDEQAKRAFGQDAQKVVLKKNSGKWEIVIFHNVRDQIPK
jgi:hypothetical protein